MRSLFVKLVSALLPLLSASHAAKSETLAFPDSWQAYMSDRSGFAASVLYNAGIAEVLEKLPEQMIVSFRIELHSQDNGGLPTPIENAALDVLDDVLVKTTADAKAYYLGRLTTQGYRTVYLLADRSAASLGGALVSAAQTAGYTSDYELQDDPDRNIYRTMLLPSPDEQRLIWDKSVLMQLADAGDIATMMRPVDHWVYFPTKAAAEMFAAWAREAGFQNIAIEKRDELPLQFLVRSQHDGTMIPEDIFGRIREQDQKARALGGKYDGWETSVMRGD
jgi:uncharacterized protein (TIGR01619 family)